MNLRILTFVLLPLAASAQLLTFGVQGGVPGQQPIKGAENTPFILGPTVDVRLTPALSLESGLLYHRIGEGTDKIILLNPDSGVTLGANRWHGHAWEVPFLAKYHFLSAHSPVRPFVTAGPTLRRTSVDYNRNASILGGTSLVNLAGQVSNSSFDKWNLDPTFGIGADFRTGRYHVEPMLRYSYWGAGKNGPVLKNQVNFLLGFRF